MSGAVDSAIGGATSAALTPYVANAITGGNPNVTSGQAAAIAAFATFAGGAAAGLAGQNVAAGCWFALNPDPGFASYPSAEPVRAALRG